MGTLLDGNLLGMVFYTPLYNEAGELTDLAFGYLNPVGQRIMRLPAQPTTTYRQLFPSIPAWPATWLASIAGRYCRTSTVMLLVIIILCFASTAATWRPAWGYVARVAPQGVGSSPPSTSRIAGNWPSLRTS